MCSKCASRVHATISQPDDTLSSSKYVQTSVWQVSKRLMFCKGATGYKSSSFSIATSTTAGFKKQREPS